MKCVKLLFDDTTGANKNAVYCPGDIVSGYCHIETNLKDANDRGPHRNIISVTLEGRATVLWTEGRSGTVTKARSASTITYSSEKTLITLKQNLTLSEDFLTPGSHCLPFSFKLPTSGLKTSFEGQYGHIRYWIDVETDGSWLSSLFKSKVKPLSFKVIERVPTTNAHSTPVGGSNSKSVGCLFFKSGGSFSVDAECNRGAYCPGDIVSVTAEFSNLSSRNVKPYIKLVQSSTFLADGGKVQTVTKPFQLTALNEKTGVSDVILRKGGSLAWNFVEFKLPQVPPTINADNIKVNYSIEAGLVIPWAIDLEVCLPVIVGTIPHTSGAIMIPAPNHTLKATKTDQYCEDNNFGSAANLLPKATSGLRRKTGLTRKIYLHRISERKVAMKEEKSSS